MIIFNNNNGCREVAEEVIALDIEDSSLIVPSIFVIDSLVNFQDETSTFLFIYINEDTLIYFDRVSRILQAVLTVYIEIEIFHEQDLKIGIHYLNHTISRTPPDLEVDSLYNNITLPFYELDEYRQIILWNILLIMSTKVVISR